MAGRVGAHAARGDRLVRPLETGRRSLQRDPASASGDGPSPAAPLSQIQTSPSPAVQPATTLPATATAAGPAAKRGGHGARWAETRQAARIARTEGVIIVLHPDGRTEVKPKPARQEENTPSNTQSDTTGERDGQKPTLTEAVGNGSSKPSKRQLKRQELSTQRLHKFQELKRRWLLLSHKLLQPDRAKLRNAVWTSWMSDRVPTSLDPPKPTPEPSPPPVLAPAPGMHVRIAGLQSKQELNDNIGIVSAYDAKAGRCAVRLRSGDSIAVRPTNLVVVDQQCWLDWMAQDASDVITPVDVPPIKPRERKPRAGRSRAKRP